MALEPNSNYSGELAVAVCSPSVETPNATSALWTCRQGAAYLAMSVANFWQRCRSGEIPHIRLSARCYRVRQSDLDEYLRMRTR
jgi:predicted DNA-binding transcriptional regulator AlpA